MNHVYTIILAGGSGTRFWPASRKRNPKQLLNLSSETARSLIGSTFNRVEPVSGKDRTYVATGEHLVEATKAHLPELGAEAFLAEPVARNTAPCIGWATRIIERRDPNALVVVIPSDQHVTDRPGFHSAVNEALRSASTGIITTIGITPTRPETGYGYIEVGDKVQVDRAHAKGTPVGDVESATLSRTSRVVRFVEKPNLERAQQYQASGRFLWNSGMFFFRAKDMSDAIRTHVPELAAGLDEIDAAARTGESAERDATRRIFPTLPAVSIDVGVLEKQARLNVVEAEFGWSDLGSFASIWEHASTDERGNAASAEAVLVDSANNLVFSQSNQKRVIALLGVQDLCVVETDDALLVMPRDRAQDVRAVVDALASKGRQDLL
ncbi:MAG: sugar phosphate nucleotidyltransferase [Polyangiaceae bacterium]